MSEHCRVHIVRRDTAILMAKTVQIAASIMLEVIAVLY